MDLQCRQSTRESNEDCAGNEDGGRCPVFSGWASTGAGTCKSSEEGSSEAVERAVVAVGKGLASY